MISYNILITVNSMYTFTLQFESKTVTHLNYTKLTKMNNVKISFINNIIILSRYLNKKEQYHHLIKIFKQKKNNIIILLRKQIFKQKETM